MARCHVAPKGFDVRVGRQAIINTPHPDLKATARTLGMPGDPRLAPVKPNPRKPPVIGPGDDNGGEGGGD